MLRKVCVIASELRKSFCSTRRMAMALSVYAFAVGTSIADDKAEIMGKLLSELRSLRQSTAVEATDAKNEFRRLRQIVAIRERNVEKTRATISKLRAELASLKAKNAKTSKTLAATKKRKDKLIAKLRVVAKRLKTTSLHNDLSLSAKNRKKLANVMATDSNNVIARCAGILSILSESSMDMVRIRLSNRTIRVDDDELYVESIDFGNVFSLWRTMDAKRCGYGVANGESSKYSTLPTTNLDKINEAFDVVRNEAPATVELLPVPVPEKRK